MTKVLIAEDDLVIAAMIRESLEQNEYEVCGAASTVDGVVALARFHRPDLILLDLRLEDGGVGSEVARQLGPVEGLGILYTSGDASQASQGANDGHACLMKPFRPRDLIRGLELVSNLVATGTAAPPFPSGFRFLRPSAPSGRCFDHGTADS